MGENNHASDDQALDDYLNGDDALSQLYAEQNKEKTPPELDQVIRSAATGKAGKRQKSDSSPRRSRAWFKPLAAVATVVLGLALTLDLLQDQAVVPVEKSVQYNAPAASENSVQPQIREQPAVTADAPKTRPSKASDADKASRPEAIAPGSAAESEPVVPDQVPEPAAPARREQASKSTSQAQAQQPPQPAPAPETQPSPQAPSEPVTPDQNNSAAPSARAQDRDLSERDLILPDNPPAAAQQSAAKPEPEYRESAQSWIRHIVFLADTDQTAQAVSELRGFREKHPNAAIPAELQDLERR